MYISLREQANFQGDDDAVRFVLDQQTELDIYSIKFINAEYPYSIELYMIVQFSYTYLAFTCNHFDFSLFRIFASNFAFSLYRHN